MSEFFDTTFQCGDGEALMTYAYGESSGVEQETVAAHLARCASCAEEVAALVSTRQALSAWTAPAQTPRFGITDDDAAGAGAGAMPRRAAILRPAVWWSRPLPAWAQMAAAVAIFASGMAIGMTRSASVSVPTRTAAAAVPPAAPAAAISSSVSREELAQVEQRLRGELAQLRSTAAVAVPVDDRGVLQRVNELIAASEARQLRELEFRTSVLATDFASRRQLDLANIEKRLGSTSLRVQTNQQDINSLAQRVGYSPAFSPYVP